MRFVGVDLHKQAITIAVVDASKKLLSRKRFSNLMTDQILEFLKSQGDFELTVEAKWGGRGWIAWRNPGAVPTSFEQLSFLVFNSLVSVSPKEIAAPKSSSDFQGLVSGFKEDRNEFPYRPALVNLDFCGAALGRFFLSDEF